MATKKYVYFFGKGKADGRGDMKDLLGGKGAGLAEMTNLGIRVPPGFTITTEACTEYYKNNEAYPSGMWDQVLENLKKVEEDMGIKFGDSDNPLLVSVRSGAKVSMPGMMDTVLNVGLNDKSVLGLAKKSKNDRFAYDAYRRFITMFGSVVMGIDRNLFEEILQEKKDELRLKQDTDLDANVLKDIVSHYKKLVKKETGKEFPMDPVEQMMMAINAVFNSWNAARAITYRKIHNLPHDMGTAASVVAMVFGNMGETSGTGVAFTRDPNSGERRFFGECLMNAQGEDVVAGIRTPFPIEELQKLVPDAYKELVSIYQKLEKHYKDMLDIEFTIQEGILFMLQTRTGKRSAAAALKIAVDMVEEGLIDKETAISRINSEQLDQLLHPMIDPDVKVKVVGRGLPASPGAAVGRAVFNAEDAEKMAKEGERCVLVRMETSPEDIGGMHAAQGILTSRGGMTSHAAVVARGMGKPCVVGCSDIQVKEKEKYFKVNDEIIKEGDYITINGSTGDVIPGEVSLIKPKLSESFATIMKWVDKIRTLKVRANADTPYDAQVARDFGAEGIGLCRTEHMFFEPHRIKAVREMILSDDIEGRKKALAKLLPIQKGDFTEIFRVMKGLPVTIRLLDPPLHEFLPHTDAEIEELSKDMGVPADRLMAKNKTLFEFNPMLGHRGCRLGITYPEIYEMQARAIFEAACELECEGVKVVPEVMIPLVGFLKELVMLKDMVDRVAEEVMKAYKVKLKYQVGTMIELPRAALVADEIAKTAEFFSFGTNDLTQTTLGLSRDDAGKFLPFYIEKGIFDTDPFVSIDQEGVGQLIKIGIEKGRSSRTNMKVGICGEHGGDPRSIDFCHRAGMDYVSCSPYRVPIARFAAAQAFLRSKKAEGN
ncbi:MAG: pyruvate, phosphate dikinase [Nitrospirae bacterium]|nr:pyruvate, phosphate dikinase [Nitrospirota bacterium]